jgi:hypothetical protein
MTYPIVIPLHHAGGKLKDDTELRYALRSLDVHFKEEFKIVIVGKALPAWLHGVELIQSNAGLKTALLDAANAYPDGFFWWYDDLALLKDQTGEEMKITPAINRWLTANTQWARSLEKIRERLVAEGRPAFDYSRPHGPYWFDKSMVDEGFADWPGMKSKFPWESWILSKRDWPRRFGVVKQYYGEFNGSPGDRSAFLNYNDAGNTPELRALLEERFPEPSRFEAQASKNALLIDVTKIHVVCLNGYAQRRSLVEESISKNGGLLADVEIEWRTGTPSENMVCPPSFRRMTRRHWWAATADHISILEQSILRQDEYLLVIEDDAMFTPDFDKVFRRACSELPSGWKALRLGWNKSCALDDPDAAVVRCGNEQGMIATLWNREGVLRFYDHTWHRRYTNIDSAFADLRRREPQGGWYQTPKRIVVDNPACIQQGRDRRG